MIRNQKLAEETVAKWFRGVASFYVTQMNTPLLAGTLDFGQNPTPLFISFTVTSIKFTKQCKKNFTQISVI